MDTDKCPLRRKKQSKSYAVRNGGERRYAARQMDVRMVRSDPYDCTRLIPAAETTGVANKCLAAVSPSASVSDAPGPPDPYSTPAPWSSAAKREKKKLLLSGKGHVNVKTENTETLLKKKKKIEKEEKKLEHRDTTRRWRRLRPLRTDADTATLWATVCCFLLTTITDPTQQFHMSLGPASLLAKQVHHFGHIGGHFWCP